MATYNLAASDLITLLNSTVTTQTGRAILESIESAFTNAFPFGPTHVQTVNGPGGPASTTFVVQGSATIKDPNDTILGPTQVVLVTSSNSTAVTGSSYTAVTSPGTETVQSSFYLTDTQGGVLIAAGDQYVNVVDKNTSGNTDTLIGGAGQERLYSSAGANVLVGGSGRNSLVGGTGADTLLGGGQSYLAAGTGANILKSSTLSSGFDTLKGGTGADLLVAQAGDNRLVAGSGANTLVGGTGRDTLISGGNTTFQLGSGATRIVESVAGAQDTIFAGSGADTVSLNYGTLNQHVSIVGSSSGLRVLDYAGSNTIIGGTGADTVVLSSLVAGASSTAPSVLQTNISNQSITAGAGGVRVITTESYANYSDTTAPGGVNTVKFSDTGQTLTINDTTGTSVTITFSDHLGVKV